MIRSKGANDQIEVVSGFSRTFADVAGRFVAGPPKGGHDVYVETALVPSGYSEFGNGVRGNVLLAFGPPLP